MAQTATNPTVPSNSKNSHNRGDETDSVNHYEYGYRTAYDNHIGYKSNDGTKVWGNAIQHLRVTLTTAEVKALNSTPIEIIPAPGAGKLILGLVYCTYLDFNSAAYVGSPTMSIEYSGGASLVTIANNILLAVADYQDTGGLVTPKGAPVLNTAVDISASADPTAGDSPLVVDIWYRILDFN